MQGQRGGEKLTSMASLLAVGVGMGGGALPPTEGRKL